jgi:hypothetical protein
MLWTLFDIIKSTLIKMVVQPMEHFTLNLNHENPNMQIAFQ